MKLEQRYMLARGTDARPVLWLQRQRLPLLGPPSHALRFDLAEPVLTTAPRAISTDTPADGQPGPAPLMDEVPVPIGTVPPPPDDPIVSMVLPPEDETPPELTPEREPLSDPPPAPLFGTTTPPELTPDPSVVEPTVVLAQALLNAAGATDAVGLPLLPDGRFGPRTTQAISSFQTTLGLTSNGLLDAATWNALMMFTPFTTLLPVDPRPEGPPIARAQSALNRIGGGPALPVTGVLDAATAAALSAFQTARFLPSTGGLDPATWLALAAIDNTQPEALLRLVFSYSSQTFGNDPFAQLELAQVLDQVPPMVEDVLPLGEHTGYWVELRDAAGNVLYRESLNEIIGFRAEAFDGSLSAPLAADPQGTFELVVPKLPRAVLLVLFGPPLQSDDRTAPSEVILTFDLTAI